MTPPGDAWSPMGVGKVITCMGWDMWKHEDHMVGVMGHHQTHQPNPSFWIYFLIRKERKRTREEKREREREVQIERERKERKNERKYLEEVKLYSVVNYDHES